MGQIDIENVMILGVATATPDVIKIGSIPNTGEDTVRNSVGNRGLGTTREMRITVQVNEMPTAATGFEIEFETADVEAMTSANTLITTPVYALADLQDAYDNRSGIMFSVVIPPTTQPYLSCSVTSAPANGSFYIGLTTMDNFSWANR